MEINKDCGGNKGRIIINFLLLFVFYRDIKVTLGLSSGMFT